MLKIKNFSTFPQGLVLWKCQDCRNCGNPWGIPTISWKTQRVFHNPLEKLKNSFSTFPQYFFLFLPLVFLFTERLVFLFTPVCVKLLTERLVFLLDFYIGDKLCLLSIGSATFMRAIFQGNMEPGEKKMGMACAGEEGNGVVLFVPPVGCQVQAVQFTVKPNETLSIPDSFCGASGEVNEVQFKQA